MQHCCENKCYTFYTYFVKRSIFLQKTIMANKKTKERKKPYGYRVEPSIKKKCARKAKTEKTTLSAKIADMLHVYSNESNGL